MNKLLFKHSNVDIVEEREKRYAIVIWTIDILVGLCLKASSFFEGYLLDKLSRLKHFILWG